MESAYRKNAAIVVFNKDKKVLLCERIDVSACNWQFPQGGIDQSEDVVIASKRELLEETSINSVTHVFSIEQPFYYDFPADLKHFNYKGQEQYWSLFYFNGCDSEINLNTKEPEFKSYKWIDIKDTINLVINFKQDTYKKAIEILEPIINDYKA